MNVDLSGYTDHQLAALIIVAVIFQVGGLAVLILKMHGTGKDAKAAKTQTVGTGNGFAKSVKDSLAEIKQSVHEISTELRTDTARLESRLDEHMNSHDRRNNNA